MTQEPCRRALALSKLLRDFGGPGRDRTDDLFHAMEARSQLRHRPTVLGDTTSCPLRTALSILADLMQIVNAIEFRVGNNFETLTTKGTKEHEGNTN